MVNPVEVFFPVQGQHKGGAASVQPSLTSPVMNNVRPRGTEDRRLRGGQRPGFALWGDGDQVGGALNPIVAICSVGSVI